jgi:hypothetical protein
MAITPIVLSPAWVGYNEPLDPSRHYIFRLFASAVDAEESARNAFLTTLAKYTGLEIPVAYKSGITGVGSAQINLANSTVKSDVTLPKNSLVTYSFFAQPVDAYATGAHINIAANVIDPRVTAILIERAPSARVTEEDLEGYEDAGNRALIAKGVARPYPYDLALQPDKGYFGVFHFTGAMPGELDIVKKLATVGVTYADMGKSYGAKLRGENFWGVWMITTGYPPTPRQLADALGAQVVYIDRRIDVTAEDLHLATGTGRMEAVVDRLVEDALALPEAAERIVALLTTDIPKKILDTADALKWVAIGLVGVLVGGVIVKTLNYSTGKRGNR